jgi:serine/threonine protein kinase
MTESIKNCPSCGKDLPADAPQGVCPSCLLAAGLAGDTGIRNESGDPPTTPHGGSSGIVPPAPADLAPRFPQLEILELIGAGGMGAVYKARQPALDRAVALKILPPEVGAIPGFAERFTREAQALAKLSHQHIVTVYDFGVADGLYFFVMEFVDGSNLRQLIKAGKLRPAEALAIVPQICEALQFAHDEGIVHRDIKPENILVDKRGRVKIADFGLARLLGKEGPEVSLTGTHDVLGTIRYMAPEQFEGSRAVDHRADIYSLGVVFYEMLTGQVPAGHFDPPSKKVQIDVRLDEVVLRALAREPERRYQQAGHVKTDVVQISRAGAGKFPVPTEPPAIRPSSKNGPGSAANNELTKLLTDLIIAAPLGLLLAFGSSLLGMVFSISVIGVAALIMIITCVAIVWRKLTVRPGSQLEGAPSARYWFRVGLVLATAILWFIAGALLDRLFNL